MSASSRLSPGAALLRSSRLFSVPKPLPTPGGEAAHVARFRSPTATQPYPTHQSITTPEAWRVVGDWGFKRSLPLPSTTKSSTPVIRVKAIDCKEKVTDFSSAADHTLSLQKFQELNLPLSLPSTTPFSIGSTKLNFKSVFEDDSDFTVLKRGRENEETRWKFKGPWLAGFTEGQFNRFMVGKVSKMRPAFRQFLKRKLVHEMNSERRQKALDQGWESQEELRSDDITNEQLTEYMWKLRSDRVTLYSLISEFLDLAPLKPPTAVTKYFERAENTSSTKRPSLYAKTGPPLSHPSGGISYLRTAAFAENHPVYGPQASHTPVLARIVAPRIGPNHAKLGVGGFITDVPQGDTSFNQRSLRGSKNVVAGIASFDPDIKGGAKSFVQPTSARVNSSGSLQITVAEANQEAQLIYKEMVGIANIYNDRTEPEPQAQPRRPLVRPFGSPRRQQQTQWKTGSSESYGLDSSESR